MGKRVIMRGTRFTIGGKHAYQHCYTDIVGKHCDYYEKRDYETAYVKVDKMGGLWYVHDEDLLPINLNTNSQAAAYLLRRDE